MEIISVSSLIEEAALGNTFFRRDSGNVSSLEEMLKAENVLKFENEYKAFAFLSFHPNGDKNIIEYLSTQTIAEDSGPDILVLFIYPSKTTSLKIINENDFKKIQIQKSKLDSSILLNEIFERKETPVLPGITVFKNFNSMNETIYFSLENLSSDEIRQKLRKIFSIVNNIISTESSANFSTALASSSQLKKLYPIISNKTSMRIWLIKAFQYVEKHFSDIVATISLLK